MLRYKPQLIALLLVLVMVQGAIADEKKKASTGEVIVGYYSCSNSIRIDFQGTSGVLATDYFQCSGEKGSLSCIEYANTFGTILEGRGCAVGIIEENPYSLSADFDFVCQGKRKKVINILGDLCSSILQDSQAE
jgi:hypothetical protein